MAAVPVAPVPTLKPRDLVRTKTGRTCRVLELMPDGSRRLQDTEDRTWEACLMPCHLELVHSAKVQPWPSHSPRDLQTSTRVKPLAERLT